MFSGVVGSGCRMHTKVVLHKQTSLRYRIQRWFRGSAARSKQNLQQNRRAAPEDACFHTNVDRTSPLHVVSGLFVQNQSARTSSRTTPGPQFFHNRDPFWGLKSVSCVVVVGDVSAVRYLQNNSEKASLKSVFDLFKSVRSLNGPSV